MLAMLYHSLALYHQEVATSLPQPSNMYRGTNKLEAQGMYQKPMLRRDKYNGRKRPTLLD